MYVSRVSLVNFRNYAALHVSLPPGLILLQGDNAQGKSNFLEAVYYLATSRSPRTNSDAEIIGPSGQDHLTGITRISAEVRRDGDGTSLEIVLAGARSTVVSPRASGLNDHRSTAVRKQIRVNGVNRRALDLLGALRVVLFRPEDLDLVIGPPAGRRRALDILLSQMDPAYPRALQRYNRVLLQRNHLLRRIANGDAGKEELPVWDEPLARHGSAILAQRQQAVRRIAQLAAGAYRQISAPSRGNTAAWAGFPKTHPAPGSSEELSITYVSGIEGDTEEDFLARIGEVRRRDLFLGQTTVGPHRDDLEFRIGGMAAASFASRGQQRSAVLAWKQAEGAYLREQTGEDPVLLLDDVLSELDSQRQRAVIGTAKEYQQVILTTTGGGLGTVMLEPAARFTVTGGRLSLGPPVGGESPPETGKDIGP